MTADGLSDLDASIEKTSYEPMQTADDDEPVDDTDDVSDHSDHSLALKYV